MESLNSRNEWAICVPLIDEASRKIMDKYLVETYGGGAYGVNAPVETWYFDDGAPNYGPWWWLWSADYVEKMLTTCGLELVDSVIQYGGTGHLYLCRVVQGGVANYGVF